MAVERRAISGAMVIVRANGREVGYAERLRGSASFTNRRVRVFGDIKSKEIVGVNYEAEFTVDFIRLDRETLVDMGLWPKGDSRSMRRHIPLVFEVVNDEDSLQVVETIYGCVPRQRTFNVDAQGLYQEGGSWDAIEASPGPTTGVEG